MPRRPMPGVKWSVMLFFIKVLLLYYTTCIHIYIYYIIHYVLWVFNNYISFMVCVCEHRYCNTDADPNDGHTAFALDALRRRPCPKFPYKSPELTAAHATENGDPFVRLARKRHADESTAVGRTGRLDRCSFATSRHARRTRRSRRV